MMSIKYRKLLEPGEIIAIPLRSGGGYAIQVNGMWGFLYSFITDRPSENLDFSNSHWLLPFCCEGHHPVNHVTVARRLVSEADRDFVVWFHWKDSVTGEAIILAANACNSRQLPRRISEEEAAAMPLREKVVTEAANLPEFIEKYLPLMQRIEVAAENAADISAGAETDTSVSFEITYLSDEFLAETDLETLLCEALEKAGCEYDMMDNGPEFFIVCETPADGRKAEKAIVSVLRKVLPPEDLEIVSVERSAANEPTRAVKLTKK